MENRHIFFIGILMSTLVISACSNDLVTKKKLTLKVDNKTDWKLMVYQRDSLSRLTEISNSSLGSTDSTYYFGNEIKNQSIILKFSGYNLDKEVELEVRNFDTMQLVLYFNKESFNLDQNQTSTCEIDSMDLVGWRWIEQVCDGNNCIETSDRNSVRLTSTNRNSNKWYLKFDAVFNRKNPTLGITGVYDPTIKTIIIDDL